MRQKIDYYLRHTDCSVTVVHPVPVVRWSCSLQKESGEFSPRRRVGGELPIGVLAELYAFLPAKLCCQLQLIVRKIPGGSPHTELPAGQINSVRTVMERHFQALHVSGRG